MSGENTGTRFVLEDITSDAFEGGAGVDGGTALLAFVAAAHDKGPDPLDVARDKLIGALGEAAMFDAAGVIGNFTMMTRIADSTGTPLDEGSVAISAPMREAMGVDTYATKRVSPQNAR